ncbi:hypothetical protein GCM10011415_26630 [Salipiger pallidus]|uniref:GAF domain-containing protein n=1 Tax=Salipiger pallidus TaxID=1775170 RepID=A0A8J2ZL72_9RHOB|nr:histidine kinase dimerization/phosphoacceptor domain -containing protein [Salipiger pallidus]GGG76555.1 hypothetical protein GCM10011415_26630 [Salipiger pallidus]
MTLAQTPENEDLRLEELRSFGVLDTPRDPDFDEVVDLLAVMLDVPVVLISLVDEDRQWFRARHGFEPSETPLDQAICSHAILNDGLLVIEDTLADDRSADNPLCCGVLGAMRFYAGAPLVTRAGYPIGTLCVLDNKPRKLTEQQTQLLTVMSRQVMRQLDLQRALRNKEVLREEIDHRVKNSLQTVASTIRLYRSRLSNEEARDALDAIGRRVDSIAQLHAELNLTSKMHHVRIDKFLDRVSHLLQRHAAAEIRIELEADALEVDSRVAAALGVVANEFAANTSKYADPVDGDELIIRFRLEQIGDNRMRFECSDNGAARILETRTDTLASTALGGRLMEAAAAQVGGTLVQGREPSGFVLRAEMPIDPVLAAQDTARRPLSPRAGQGDARAAE